MRVTILGVPFDNVSLEEAVEIALRLAHTGKGAYCVTPNSEIVYESTKSASLKKIICDADLILPDGAGVLAAGKILKKPLREKVAGIDFAKELLRIGAKDNIRFYFLGGKPGIAEKAADNLKKEIPGLQIVGSRDGYFTDEKGPVDDIRHCAPDVLFVCLGAPKQEKFMYDYHTKLPVHFMVGLGGSLDIFAGEASRAPQWMIKANLEWLYRLLKQPTRIGRMMRLPRVLLLALSVRLKGEK